MQRRRIIFHIDVNSAFLSWTAVKLISQGHEDIRLIPSVVSGDPSDRRSIVTAASIPAKKLGVKTAMPVTMAMKCCPELKIVQGDRSWYRECSDRFIEICRSYSPVLQQFSIDECFIDMTFRTSAKNASDVAMKLKAEIYSKLGFTVNIGIGSNKLLAKMASDFEKPDKIHELWIEDVPEKMWPLNVRDLLWVGKKTEIKLREYGLKTIGDLAATRPELLSRIIGKKFACQIHEYANGRDDSPVETEYRESKSISAERTFQKDICNARDMDRSLFKIACIVAHRLRRKGLQTSCISLFLKDKDFNVVQKQCQTAIPTDVTAVILNEARTMLNFIWNGKSPIRQIGLGLSKFTNETVIQLSLFEEPKMEYYRQWDREYDKEYENENENENENKYDKNKAGSL